VASESNTLSVPVYSRDGAEVGKIDVSPDEFGGKINRQLLHDAVLMYLANQRAGTHSTLRRGEVSGSTKKLFRQKGTGNARVGTKRTNKRRGGGTAKGPKPRDYEYHMPKKAVRAATRMAILSKLADNETVVVEDLNLPQAEEGRIKTKEMAKVLKALKLHETTCLVGTATPPVIDPAEKDEKKVAEAKAAREAHARLYKATRNIENVKMLPAAEFNAYTVLRQKRLILTKEALEELRKGPPKGVTIEKPEHPHTRRKKRGAKAKAEAAAERKPQAKKK
jgi:large subunit ribosomal protein L4